MPIECPPPPPRNLPFPCPKPGEWEMAGRPYPGDLGVVRPYLPLFTEGRADLMTTDAAATGITRYKTLAEGAAADGYADPYQTAVVATLDVPSGWKGYEIAVKVSLSAPQVANLVNVALYSGDNLVLGPWEPWTDVERRFPLQADQADGGRSFSLRAVVLPDGYTSSGTTPIRTQVQVTGSMTLFAVANADRGC